ncbi:hypothetical protein AB0K60_31240 [Thermopolyspora sp. NPDC052614]|uniref:hypothetical protein n=1 Tax=Thermopolyspora sp. NPDC052614 TaxID=3155682 RepID=UPI0034171005
MAAYPTANRRVLAEYLAGVVLTAVVGVVPLLRMLVAGDEVGMSAWGTAVLFIPALALALGTISRTHRLFQIIYLAVVRGDQRRPARRLHGAGPGRRPARGAAPDAIAGLAPLLLGSVFLTRTARRRLGG